MIDPIGDAITKIQAAASQVIKDAIGQSAAVLVPAVAEAAKGVVSGISVTVTIEPIVVRMELK